jgi:hypothetical protein
MNLELRKKLYGALFLRIGDYDYLTPWYEDIARGHVFLIKHIQEFIVHSSGVSGGDPINLGYFVDDIITFIDILNTPHSDGIDRSNREILPQNRFWATRLQSWKDRWAGQLNDETNLEGYVEGLCDALFGVWSKPGNRLLFHDGKGNYKCADHIFTTLSSGLSDDPKIIRDYHLFDAAYIETNGPFRFKPTDRLDRHMVIKDHDIYFFNNWRKWTYLCCHIVLQSDEPNTGFEILCNSRRGRVRVIRRYARATGSIPISLVLMVFLCFHREALEYIDYDFHHPKIRTSRFNFICPFPIRKMDLGSKRREIAKRIGVDLSPLESLRDVANRRQHDEWGLSLHLEPFDERASRMLETLSNWKPETFWGMRYPGYGGVDPIGLYGFHFAIVVGILTFFGFALGIAQTIASFEQINLGGGKGSG